MNLLRWIFWGVLRLRRAPATVCTSTDGNRSRPQGPRARLAQPPRLHRPVPTLRRLVAVVADAAARLSRHIPGVHGALAGAAGQRPGGARPRRGQRAGPQRGGEAVAAIVAGLGRGERFILWPAGRVWRDGVERIGPARAAADILRPRPETRAWCWCAPAASGARRGPGRRLDKRPPLVRLHARRSRVDPGQPALLHAAPPRRDHPRSGRPRRLPEPRREMLNPWLEQWYNGDLGGSAETPTWVPYHFLFGRRTFDFPPPTAPEAEIDLGTVRPETRTGRAEPAERPAASGRWPTTRSGRRHGSTSSAWTASTAWS